MNILEEVEKIEEYIINMRRWFHQNPEISWNEYNTSDKICKELEKNNIPYTRVLKTGVIGNIGGNKKKPIIGIRADIDALEVEEKTELKFKSKTKGVMHACGHDAHIAMLLATAKLLKKHEDKLDCSIRLIFQPAEEYIKDSGAKYLAELDDIKEIDNIIGAHIWNYLDTGTISVESGPRMSSADTFKIEVIGKGGHGAKPNETIDPIVTSVNIINNLQTLLSREISPMDPCVLSVCSINSGSSSNIIPNSATLKGTTRTFSNELREVLPEKMERIISNTCKSFRADYIFEYYPGTPPTINDKNSSQVAEKAVKKILGDKGLVKYEASMVGEDFSKLLNIIPGCIAFIGAKDKNKSDVYPHHNPKFDIDESAMKYGVAFFIQYVLDIQKKIND